MNFPLKKIFVVDASKRSSHSNAYYFGFGNNKRIVLFDTLIKQHEGEQGIEEILALVKHELGHWYYSHPLKMIILSLTNLSFMFLLFSFTINNHGILASFGFTQESNFVSFLLFSKLYEVFAWLTGIMTTALSRHFEF
jgi:STE24 endopeptidase